MPDTETHFILTANSEDVLKCQCLLGHFKKQLGDNPVLSLQGHGRSLFLFFYLLVIILANIIGSNKVTSS